MINELVVAASGAYMLGDWIYHRWFYEPPKVKIKPQEVSIPRVDPGAIVPLIYGKCRVRAPLLVWTDTPTRTAGTGSGGNGWPVGTPFYSMNMFLVLGVGMDDGAGTSKVHGMWIGDRKLLAWNVARETQVFAEISAGNGIEPGQIGGLARYYDGHAAQDIGASHAGGLMTGAGVPLAEIPGYRGYIAVELYGTGVGTPQYIIGGSPNVPAYSFEASSYQTGGSYPGTGIYGQIGEDSNPMNVAWDMWKARLGKLGISTNYLDSTSFSNAAATLAGESHGYSRCIESIARAGDYLRDIAEQVDCAFYVDETDGKLKVKLIRADFDPNAIVHITKDNCVDLVNISFGGHTNLTNRIRLEYLSRARGYIDDYEPAQGPGNSSAQSGVINEEAVQMLGVSHADLAARMAYRELAWRGRNLIKLRAIVDRSFIRVNPGDPIKITWTKPPIAGLVFRVAAVDRGTLTNGRIALDLVQDANFVWRNRIPQRPALVDRGGIGSGFPLL